MELLHKLEDEQQINILYACESGSRAWGFPSPDSDYDIRFIYVQKRHRYLSIEENKENVEMIQDNILDVVGYDLRKTLKLFRRSNSGIFEWLNSPIVYKKEETFFNALNALGEEYLSPKTAINHYLGLARNTYQSDLQSPRVKIKKLLYVLRAVLAAAWIAELGTIPPMTFKALRSMVTDSLISEKMARLLEIKADVDEAFQMEQDLGLNAYIREQIAKCDAHVKKLNDRKNEIDSLNALFQRTVSLYDDKRTES